MSPILCSCGCGQIIRLGKIPHKAYKNDNGYMVVYDRSHPKSGRNGLVFEHTLVMEKALGRPILKSEAIHHIDGDTTNNSVGNLLLFKTHSMHHAYEARQRAFKACGHYDWRQCRYCHRWDSIDNLIIRKGSKGGAFHPNRRTNKNCCG